MLGITNSSPIASISEVHESIELYGTDFKHCISAINPVRVVTNKYISKKILYSYLNFRFKNIIHGSQNYLNVN